MLELLGENVKLRLVEVEDAQFILSLRLDPRRAKFLNETDSSLEKQVDWINEYKKREAKKEEYYFLIQKNNKPLGNIRIYKISDAACFWGSWITKPGSAKGCGKEALLLVLKFIFEELKKEQALFTVEKDNEKGNELYRELGAEVIKEDSKEFTFSLSKDGYYNTAIKRLSR